MPNRAAVLCLVITHLLHYPKKHDMLRGDVIEVLMHIVSSVVEMCDEVYRVKSRSLGRCPTYSPR